MSVVTLAQAAEGFPETPDAAATRLQLQDQYKVMREAGKLAEFAPVDEKGIEDWLDAMWASVSSESLAATIMDKKATGYEELVSKVALELFPHSRYVLKLEEELWNTTRQPTVHSAVMSLRMLTARYLRLTPYSHWG
eukprot:GHVN01041649.1.p1 GENE.GHVN01041649.1~~GHVN01041649.1.p1  ORF type:complete len:137 (+),score=17.37 GHVN01041649.1:213-623(+)